MKDAAKRLVVLLVVALVVGQTCLPFISVNANASTLVSMTEFSETTRNTNLTNKLTVFPSPIYLKDPNTNEWIPTTNGERGSFPVYQTFISEELPTSNLSSQQHLAAGKQGSMQNMTLLKFGNELPDLNGGLIQNATLHMFEVDKPVKWGYYDPTYIDSSYRVHKVLTAWDGEDVTWTNQPGLSDPYADKTLRIGVDGGHFQWDISRMVAEWYQAPQSDFGLAIMGNEPDSYRQFYTSKGHQNKSYNDMDKAPRLEINYAPRPAFHSALGYGLGANSGEGYVRLAWQSVQGAKGYKLSIFNGKEYETIDIGMTNEWSSLNKNLWPSANEIKNGAYELTLDQSGTNLPDNPADLYNNAGGAEKDPNRYYFKITAYNEIGESGASEEISVKVPNRTAPNPVQNINLSDFTKGEVSLTWDASNSNIKEYAVRIGTTPEKADIASGSQTSTNKITVTASSLQPRMDIYVSVNAIDHEGNYSGYSIPVPFSLGEKQDATLIAASIPERFYVTGNPSITITMKNSGTKPWTMEEGFALKAVNGLDWFEAETLKEGEVIAPNELKTFQLKAKGKNPLGAIPLEWQMYSSDNGFFGDVVTGSITFYDDVRPGVQIASPKPSDSLYKTVEIVGTVTDYTLKDYSLYYGAGTNPQNWVMISKGTTEVNNGLLGSWDTAGLSSGVYTLKLTAIDEAGNTNTVMQEVHVNLPVPAPIVNKVTDQSTKVTGSAEYGTTVFVQKGDQLLGSSPVTTSGTYSLSIPKQLAGTTLKVVAKNKAGIVSVITSVKVVDVTPPAAPKINTIGDNDTKVTGTAEKGSRVTVKRGTVTLGSAQVNSEGKYSVTIAKQKAGTTINVTAKDAAGNVSAASTKIVVDKTPPAAPKVNVVGDNATTVKGTAEKGATITVKVGSKTLGSSKVKSDGTYSVGIAKQKAGTILSVTATDAAKNISGVTKRTVVDKTPPAPPKVNIVYSTTTLVKGKTEAYATVTVKKGTKTLGSAKANSKGDYSVKITKQPKKTTLTITAKDRAGNQSKATSITVK